MDLKILKLSLLAGSVFFFMIAAVHFPGLKIPGLYIYYNLDSYPFQDRIISALSFGWASFFFVSFKTPQKIILKAVLLSGIVAITILTVTNCQKNIHIISKIETGILFLYWLWLTFCVYKLSRKKIL